RTRGGGRRPAPGGPVRHGALRRGRRLGGRRARGRAGGVGGGGRPPAGGRRGLGGGGGVTTGVRAPAAPAPPRSQFPALAREVGGAPAVYLDGPGGSQVPRSVIEAVARYLEGSNANLGGAFVTSAESDAIVAAARGAAADFTGSRPEEI